MEKRILPPRSTRGKRQQPSDNKESQQSSFYSDFFKKAQQEYAAINQKSSINAKQQKAIGQAQYVAFDHKSKLSQASNNRNIFPFTRGYHYECDMSSLPRVEGSPSYAVDNTNVLKVNYSQDEKLIGNSKLGDILNRKLVGLPLLSSTISGNIKQKNPCSCLLFQNQDKKYAIDRLLIELKHICKNLESLINLGKINSYQCLKKDAQLIAVLETDITLDQKRNILNKRIKVLSDRKKNMQTFFSNQDNLYYDYSLNQQLHQQVSTHQNLLNYKNLMYNISRRLDQKESIERLTMHKSKLSSEDINKLFIYQNCRGLKSISIQAIDKIASLISNTVLQKNSSNQLISQLPILYLTFQDKQVMSILQKLIVEKIMNESQVVFYAYKSFWKKVFNKKLRVNDEPKTISHNQFHKTFNTFLNKLKKFDFKEQNFDVQKLDKFADIKSIEQIVKEDKLFNVQYVKLSSKEYLALCLINNVYMAIKQIMPILQTQQNLSNFIKIISSDYYGKYHYVFVGIIQNSTFGLLNEAIKKAIQVFTCQQVIQQKNFRWYFDQQMGNGFMNILLNNSALETQPHLNEQQMNQKDEAKRGRDNENYDEQEKDKVIKKRKIVQNGGPYN